MAETAVSSPAPGQRSTGKWLAKWGVACAIGLSIGMIAIALVLQIPGVRAELKAILISQLESRLKARVSIGELSVDRLAEVSITDVRITSDVGDVIVWEHLSGRLLLPLLFEKTVYASAIQCRGLKVNLVRYPDGSSSLSRLVASIEESESPAKVEGPSLKVIVGELTMTDAEWVTRDAGDPEKTEKRIKIDRFVAGMTYGKEMEVEIIESAIALGMPGIPDLRLAGKVRFDPLEGQVDLDSLDIRSDVSSIRLSGEVRGSGTIPAFDLQLILQSVDIADLSARVGIDGEREGILKGRVTAKGDINRFTHELALSWKDMEITTTGEVRLESIDAIGLTLTGGVRRIDPAQLSIPALSTEAGDVNADFRLSGRLSSTPFKIDTRIGIDILPSKSSFGEIQGGNVEVVVAGDRLTITEGTVTTSSGVCAASGTVTGMFQAGSRKEIQAAVSLKNVTLPQSPSLTPPGISGRMTLDLTAAGVFPSEFDLSTASLDMGVKVKDATLSVLSGVLTAAAASLRMEKGDIQIREASLFSSVGNLQMEGNLTNFFAAEKAKRAWLKTRLRGFDPRIFPAAKRLSGKVDLDLDVEAQLPTDMSLRKSRIRLSGRADASRVGDIAISRGNLSVDWQEGELTIESLDLATDRGTVKVEGRIDPVDRTGDLRVEAMVPNLRRVIADLQHEVTEIPENFGLTGAARVSAAASGSLDAAVLSLDCQGEGVGTGNWGAESIQLTGNWKGSLKRFEGSAEMAVSVADTHKNRWETRGRAVVSRNGSGQLTLDTFSFDSPVMSGAATLEPETLKNEEPIRLHWQPGALVVDACRLRSGAAELSLTGALARGGPQNLHLAFSGLNLSRLSTVLKWKGSLAGVVSGSADIGGPADAPLIDARIHAGNLSGFEVDGAELDVKGSYADDKSKWDVSLIKNGKTLLSGAGDVDVRLRLSPFLFDLEASRLNFILKTAGLRLSDLPIPKFKDISFDAATDIQMTLSGPLAAPSIGGTVGLTEGHLSLPKKGLTYETLTATIRFADENIEIEEFLLKGDKEGQLNGSGMIAFKGIDPRHFHIVLVGKDFLIPYEKAIYARATTVLELTGSPASPVLTGEVSVIESKINLDKMVTQSLPEIQLIGSPSEQGDERSVIADQAPSDLSSGLATNVAIKIIKNAWLKGQSINTEITGELILHKDPGKAFALQGELTTVRGTYYFRGKQFDIENGTVQFIGLEDPNPSIRMRAVTQIEQVDIILNISGTARKLILALDSDPQMDQSDIISYVVFGKPTDALKGGQAFNAEKAAMSFSGGLLATELRRLVGDTFFLDAFGVESSQNGGHSVSLGKYVRPNIFVSYQYGLQEEDPNQVEISYEFSPNIRVEAQLGNDKNSGVDLFWEFNF